MKSFKKNQIVIYTFALMLVAAGYLNYTSKVNKDSLETANQETYVSENETSDIGDAKLVNSNDVVDVNDKTNENVEENITEEENMFVSYIRNYAFVFIIMAITVSATYPATDTTAGERERGTLETLLTFPIKSRDIIVGKFLAVTIASILTGIISLVLAIISVAIAQNAFSIYEGLNIMFSPISILLSVIIIIAYSFFISGLCIAIASSSKTFKKHKVH